MSEAERREAFQECLQRGVSGLRSDQIRTLRTPPPLPYPPLSPLSLHAPPAPLLSQDWIKADDLVATDAEREDLDYLRERERRVGSNAIAE